MPFDDPRHADRPGRTLPVAGWHAVCLLDSWGTGVDLAHTRGLSELGLPELLLRARPTEGDDLGADWLLPPADRTMLIDRWATDWIEGALRPGDEREVVLDHGTAVCRFRFGAAVAADDLPHLDLDDRTAVVPISWSLSRRPPHRPVAPTTAARRRVESWRARAETVTAHWRRLRAPVTPSPALAAAVEKSGPMRRWVSARVDSLLAVDGPTLQLLTTNARIADRVRPDERVQADLLALAHRAGRGGAARELENAAELLVIALSEDGPAPDDPGPGRVSAWDVTTRRLGGSLPAMPRPDVEEAVFDQVREAVRLILLAAAVADLAPNRLVASAVGAWEWAASGRPPGRPWLAPPSAREWVRTTLADVDPRELVLSQVLPPEGPVPDQLEAAVLVRGLQLTTGASTRERLLTRARREGLTAAQADRAEEVAATLLALSAVPERVDPALWEVVTAPLRSCVPGLPVYPPGQEWLL